MIEGDRSSTGINLESFALPIGPSLIPAQENFVSHFSSVLVLGVNNVRR
jgi:hypothetical protein